MYRGLPTQGLRKLRLENFPKRSELTVLHNDRLLDLTTSDFIRRLEPWYVKKMTQS